MIVRTCLVIAAALLTLAVLRPAPAEAGGRVQFGVGYGNGYTNVRGSRTRAGRRGRIDRRGHSSRRGRIGRRGHYGSYRRHGYGLGFYLPFLFGYGYSPYVYDYGYGNTLREYVVPPPAVAQPTEEAPAPYDTSDCREYTRTVVIDGEEHEAHGTACRQADGNWRLVN